ncbi:MAG: TMEM14 family protein [Verrucomicrobiales bacterium]|nr:TMEM14 family protein [Verrucomicrobiales bacterium]
MKPEAILWIYLVLLLAGGVIGFVKAKSTVSLVMSVVFGALLALCALKIIPGTFSGDLILIALVGVFANRFQKTRKLVPAGVMTIVTIAALLVRGMMLLG